MKSITIPGLNPSYEIIITDQRWFNINLKFFSFTYRKIWPSEDGIFEAPRIHQEGLSDVAVKNYAILWANPSCFANLNLFLHFRV